MKSYIKKLGLVVLLFSLSQVVIAQIVGGQNVYTFLNLSNSARITGLGGNLITVYDDDAALGYHNPAVLNAAMHQQMSFSTSPYFSDISHGYASYAHHIDNIKSTIYAGIQYTAYGDFDGLDPMGQSTGTFSANDYALSFGIGHRYNERLSFGANAKLISSQLESYNSYGIASDWAAFYQDTSKNITFTLVFKNVGTQFTTYFPDNPESLPFDVQIGFSKRLKYLPFRFSIIAHNLQRWDIRYDDPDLDEPTLLFGDDQQQGEQSFFFDTFFRHIIINGEFLLGKRENLRLRIGYNHLRRGELSVPNTVSFSGFTFGVGLKIKQFRIDYGRGVYHLGGGANHFTISTSFQEFKK